MFIVVATGTAIVKKRVIAIYSMEFIQNVPQGGRTVECFVERGDVGAGGAAEAVADVGVGVMLFSVGVAVGG